MRKTHWLMGVVWVGGMVSVLVGQEMPAPTGMEEEPNEVRLHAGNETEYRSLFEAVSFEVEQERAVREKIARRATELTAWVESEKGKELIRLRTELAEARRNRETEKIGLLRETIQPLADEYMQLRARTRVEILDELSEKQREAYVGRSLMQRVTSGMRKAELTDGQSKAIREMCMARASAYVSTTTVKDDPYFRQLDTDVPAMRKTVMETVLTPAQRAMLDTPRATTRPTE